MALGVGGGGNLGKKLLTYKFLKVTQRPPAAIAKVPAEGH